MGQVSAIIDYFRTVSTNHKSILHTESEKHFFRYSLTEMLNSLRSSMEYPAIGLENISGNIDDLLSDNKRNAAQLAFILIKPCPLLDFENQEEIMDEMFEIGIDILGKIHKDLHIDSPIKVFNFQDVDYSPIGPIFENHFGYRFAFTINNPAKIRFDGDKWNNESNYP